MSMLLPSGTCIVIFDPSGLVTVMMMPKKAPVQIPKKPAAIAVQNGIGRRKNELVLGANAFVFVDDLRGADGAIFSSTAIFSSAGKSWSAQCGVKRWAISIAEAGRLLGSLASIELNNLMRLA